MRAALLCLIWTASVGFSAAACSRAAPSEGWVASNAATPARDPRVGGGDFAPRHASPIPLSFLVHDAGWASFRYPPSARDRVGVLVGQAEDARSELAELLGQPPLAGVEIRIARAPGEVATLGPQDELPPPGATSASYPALKLVVLSVGGPARGDGGEALRRGLADLALAEAVGPRTLPPWFSDGFAVDFAGSEGWRSRWLLFRSSLSGSLVRLVPEGVDGRSLGGPLALAQGADFLDYLVDVPRRTRFPTLIEDLRDGEPLSSALGEAYGAPATSVEGAWRRSLARRATVSAAALVFALPVSWLAGLGVYRLAARRRRRPPPDPSVTGARRRAPAVSRQGPHIALGRREARESGRLPEGAVPKVQHDGEWHTLH